jgi:beta-fructofuranosidase
LTPHDEIYRPKIHLSPRQGWINDPNAPFRRDGAVHLYFQYNPDANEHRDIQWGHATSTDMLRWRSHGIAIAPTTDLDRDGVYSGTAVVAGDEVHAFYSGFRLDRQYQPVLRAVSRDGGYRFGPAEPVLAEPDPAQGIGEYRDPFVWRDGAGWRMLVGCSLPDGRGGALAYTSDDLTHWETAGIFASGHARTMFEQWGADSGEMWECPQRASVDGTSVLLVSAFRRGTGPMRVVALAGDETGNGFMTRHARYLDDGPDFFAAYLLALDDGRTMVWGWGRESLRVPSPVRSWSGLLTLPRQLGARADGQVGSWPARELATLRQEVAGTVLSGSPVHDVPRTFELAVSLPFRPSDAATTITLDFGGDSAGIRILADPAAGSVVVDPAGAYSAALIQIAGEHENLELRWFVDRSVSELFVSDGSTATHRVYPPAEGMWSLSMRAPAGVSGRVWRLDEQAVAPAAADDADLPYAASGVHD